MSHPDQSAERGSAATPEVSQGLASPASPAPSPVLSGQAWQRYGEGLLGLAGQVSYEYFPASGRRRWGSSLEAVLGYLPEADAGGADPWLTWIHPEDRADTQQRLEHAAQTFGTVDAEYRLRHQRGNYVWVRDRGICVAAGPARTDTCLVGLLQDVSDRWRANEALRLDEQRLDALQQLTQMTEASLAEITDSALEEGVRLTRSQLGYLAFTNPDESVLTMHAWSKSAMAECAVSQKPLEYPLEGVGLWGEVVRQRRPIITNDYAAPNPLKRGLPAGHVALQRHLSVPVFDGERIVAVAGVANKIEPYDATDVRQLTLLMQGMWRLVQGRRAAEALCESEARCQAMVNAAPWGMHFYRLESEGGLIFSGANPTADRILGLRHTDLVGRPIETAFPGLVGSAVAERYRAIAQYGGVWRLRQFAYAAGEVSGSFDVTAFQTAPGQMAAAFVDVTERGRVETALRESEARYRGVVENSLVGICISSDETILYANQTLIRMGGYDSLAEFAAKPVSAHFTPASAALANAHFAARARGEPVPREFDVEGLRRDGAVRILRLCTSSVYLDGRKCELSAFVDVTDQRHAEAERLEMQRRLLHAQKLESLGVLAGGIAHDFNNLLMAVLGNLDLALMDLPPSSPARASIEPAVQASRRATDLTREMLAYSGKGHFLVQRLALNDLVQGNADLLRAVMARTVTLHLLLGPQPAEIEADPGQLQQVVMNLITNASEAIGETTGVVTLVTGVQECDAASLSQSRLEVKPPPGRFAYLEVRDSGGGMDEETQQRLFDPFFTTKATGRGLGMSAVLGIMRGHKGAIFVDSAVGQGTRVRVLFPVCTPASGLGDAAGAKPGPVRSTPSLSGTVLVVDDDEAVRALAVRFVRRLGLQALEAADGHLALACFREHAATINCVLLDLTMPRLDGVATFRELQRLRPGIRVVLCSGYSQQDAVRRFGGEGLSGFLQKPYSLPQLERHLEALLPRAGD